jgi:hypothetical protein
MPGEEIKEILPSEGVWSVEDLAKYLKMRPDDVQQKLTDCGIKVLHLGTRYKARLVRLEDLRPKNTDAEVKK